MIFIVVKWPVKPEHADDWPTIVADFTAGTRGEEGNLWFDWSRNIEDPNEYVLVEAFAGQEAAVAHVSSAHFRTATEELGKYLVSTPKIINVQDLPDGWNDLAEIPVR